MDIGINDLRTLVTAAAFITFVGIVAWAYSGRRADHYEKAARLATDDEQPAGKEYAK
jgi:cytochrome c oxidase cbb3-type subunit 4